MLTSPHNASNSGTSPAVSAALWVTNPPSCIIRPLCIHSAAEPGLTEPLPARGRPHLHTPARVAPTQGADVTGGNPTQGAGVTGGNPTQGADVTGGNPTQGADVTGGSRASHSPERRVWVSGVLQAADPRAALRVGRVHAGDQLHHVHVAVEEVERQRLMCVGGRGGGLVKRSTESAVQGFVVETVENGGSPASLKNR